MKRIFIDLEMNPISFQYRHLKKICRQEIADGKGRVLRNLPGGSVRGILSGECIK